MNYYMKPASANPYFNLFLEDFDSNLKIDLKKSSFIFIQSIIFSNKNFIIIFTKDPKTNLLQYHSCQKFNSELNFNLILEDLYLWVREMEIKYYGEQILNIAS